MDIYEFTQVLWRRKWLLLAGSFLLVAFIVAVSFDFSDGMQLRSKPSYEADVRMAVVPEGYESLGQDLGTNPLSGTAQVFASLLSTRQAVAEISEQEGVRILEMQIGATGRDRFLTATVLAATPDDAVTGALGTFRWLERRLSQPILAASTPSEPIPEPQILDADGLFRGTVRIEADHALATEAEGLWIVAETDRRTVLAYRLADAAAETAAQYRAVLTPGEEMSVRLEDSAGDALDAVAVLIPALPENATTSFELLVGMNRGMVRGTAGNPLLDPTFIDATWIPTEPLTFIGESEASNVGLLLLTDAPVPKSIGGRKAPLIMIGLFTAGIIALLVVAVITDSWSQERKRRKASAEDQLDVTGISPTMDEVDEILRRVSS